MTSQVLYRKWRSQTFAELVGQEHVTRTLLNQLEMGRVGHAYLFCGPRGTGKTSAGRLLAKAVNCLNNGRGEPCNRCQMCLAITEGRALDLIEIDAASNRGINEIRELREKVNFSPAEAHYKVYIVDEVHMLTKDASNALLKTLEEPPPHAIFVLATTEPHQVPETILSRCQRFDFRRISLSAIVGRLKHICAQEGISIETGGLELIAQASTGSLRDAENLVEQSVAYYGMEVSLEQVRALLGLTGDARLHQLAQQILQKRVSEGLATIRTVADDGLDLRQFTKELVEYLRRLMLLKLGGYDGANELPERLAVMRALVSGVSSADLLGAVKLFSQVDLRFEGQSMLPLELALVEFGLGEKPVVVSSIPPSGEVVVPALESVPATSKVGKNPVQSSEKTSALDLTHVVSQLAANWGQVLEQARSVNKTIEALLRSSCEPMSMEEDTLVLGFYYPYHKAMIEQPANLRIVEELLSRVLGRRCQVRCELKSKEKKAVSSASSGDPLVQFAVNNLGARAVPRR